MNASSELLAAIASHTRQDGDHVLWSGTLDRGMPYIRHEAAKYAPRRVILEHHLGRAVVGMVKPSCGEPLCVAPDHLVDNIGRREARETGRPVKAVRNPAETRTGRAGRRYRKGIAEPGEIPTEAVWAFKDRLHRIGEHLVWQGTTSTTTPVLVYKGTRWPALQVAWVLHHGRKPVGQVQASCGQRLCVAGPCLTDQAMRQREQHLMAALFGKRLDGDCINGHPRADFGMVRTDGTLDCRGCDVDRHKRSMGVAA